MKLTSRIFKGLIALKNKQIKLERERSRGYKETNDILAAYLALLVEKHGSARVPKELIREALGGYRATVGTAGDGYVITVERCGGKPDKISNGETEKAVAEVGNDNPSQEHSGDGEN